MVAPFHREETFSIVFNANHYFNAEKVFRRKKAFLNSYLMIFEFQGKKLVSIVPKPDSDDATSPNMFKSLAGGLKSDKKCRKVTLDDDDDNDDNDDDEDDDENDDDDDDDDDEKVIKGRALL